VKTLRSPFVANWHPLVGVEIVNLEPFAYWKISRIVSPKLAGQLYATPVGTRRALFNSDTIGPGVKRADLASDPAGWGWLAPW